MYTHTDLHMACAGFSVSGTLLGSCFGSLGNGNHSCGTFLRLCIDGRPLCHQFRKLEIPMANFLLLEIRDVHIHASEVMPKLAWNLLTQHYNMIFKNCEPWTTSLFESASEN